MASPPELLTAYEVAELLKVNVRTVWRWARSGRIRRVRIGGVSRYRADDLVALLDSGAATRR